MRVTDGERLHHRKAAGRGLAAELGHLGPGQGGSEGTDEDDDIAGYAEPDPAGPRHVGGRAHHAHDGGGEDRAGGSLVVERDVTPDHWYPERLTRAGQTLDRLGELPGHVGLLRVAEVQAVGQAERLRP